MEKFSDYWHYLHKSSKNSLYIVNYRVVDLFEERSQKNKPYETCQPKKSEEDNNIESIVLSTYEDKDNTNEYHESVKHIPSL